MLEKRIIVHIWGVKSVYWGHYCNWTTCRCWPWAIFRYIMQGTGMQFKPIMAQNLEFMRCEEFFLPDHVHCITLNWVLCKVLVADWFGLPWIMFPPNIASNTQIEHGAMCWLPIDFCHLSIDHTQFIDSQRRNRR